ncbi:MAG: RHS repeat protein [bacterium]|nr:RHS repeat protein [bacterium]
MGNLTAVTDAVGNVSAMTYDSLAYRRDTCKKDPLSLRFLDKFVQKRPQNISRDEF